MKLKVLNSLSQQDELELDRLQRSVWDAEFEFEQVESGMSCGEVLQDAFLDSKRILEMQRVNLLKFKQEMIEKYLVDKFYQPSV